MAWKKVLPMDERFGFVLEVRKGETSVSALCRRYGVSRPTGYKWIERFESEGVDGLRERSRRPLSCPCKSSDRLIELIVVERRRHPTWGPKKIRHRLLRRGVRDVPSASTIGEILSRAGFVKQRKRRGHRKYSFEGPLTEAEYPNHVWTADFKGWFRTVDGKRCDPLTVKDLYSRYILTVKALPNETYEKTREVFSGLFKEFGLPEIVRSDNGSPFASTGAGGLSRFSVWLLLNEVCPEFIAKGHPEQNGAHEQTHRILKEGTVKPPAANCQAQQRRFNRWVQEYNEERPHESLGMKTPSEIYEPSKRRYTGEIQRLEYPKGYHVRRVRSNGQIKWRGGKRFISDPLVGQLVGIKPVENGVNEVYFAEILLGDLLDGETGGLRPTSRRPLGGGKEKETFQPGLHTKHDGQKCKPCLRIEV